MYMLGLIGVETYFQVLNLHTCPGETHRVMLRKVVLCFRKSTTFCPKSGKVFYNVPMRGWQKSGWE